MPPQPQPTSTPEPNPAAIRESMPEPGNRPCAIALLSGGLDSATAAALAQEEGYQVIGLSFDYGQRHRRELEAARLVAASLGLAEHHTISVNLAAWGGSALTDPAIPVPCEGVQDGVIPSTYVPGRNTVFIALGLSLAEARGAERLVVGVNAARTTWLLSRTWPTWPARRAAKATVHGSGHRWWSGAKPRSCSRPCGWGCRSPAPGAATAAARSPAGSATAAASATMP
jgi:hypothetical protein